MIRNENDFIEWLDQQLDAEIPDHVIAFNINIYESPFGIEIVGSTEYDADDEDWACREDWIPENRRIPVSDQLFGDSWEEAQECLMALARAYLASSAKNRKKLKSAKAFALGFVDGNLSYVQ